MPKVLLSVTLFLFSFYANSQKVYELPEPINAVVRGKVFLYEDLGWPPVKVFGIKAGDTVTIKGKAKSNGNYLIDYKECIDCAIQTFFIEPTANKRIDLIFDEIKDKIKNNKRVAKEKLDSLAAIRDSINAIKFLEEERQMIAEYKSSCQYARNEKDEFTGKLHRYTEKYCIEQDPGNWIGQFCIQLRRIGNIDYAIFEHFIDLGCTSSYEANKSVVLVKLENDDIVKFYHYGKTDCGSFRLIGRLTEGDKNKLKKSPISIIRLEGTDSYFDVEDIVYKDMFIDKIDCLDN
ncbi:MAG: hypothetical protein H2058_13575 [Muricauda sp.]|nr:hypothetical protein [Allomuricauda sp.]MBA4746279.1 hypothetical protein [Allomuricauda sp.]